MRPFKIEIREKLKPFSHSSWFRGLLPGTRCLVEVFPTYLHINEWDGGSFKQMFDLTGPVKGFTVESDVKKGVLRVFGRAQEGAFSYLLFAEEGKLCLFLEKGSLPFPMKMKQELMDLVGGQGEVSHERLSLGMHRKQEWDLVLRRLDMREIFPVWFALGQMLPELGAFGAKKMGNYALLKQCKTVLHAGERAKIVPAFENLLLAGFSGLMVPHLNDPRYLGLSKATNAYFSPLPLLQESARLIRALFFHEKRGTFSFLPLLPPECHAGRFLQVRTGAGDRIDFEWTKKVLCRVIIRPGKSRKVRLKVQKGLKSFRLRTERGERGERCLVEESLALIEGQAVFLDRFNK